MNLQIYFNTLDITIANNAKVDVLRNISFKYPIEPYFF